MAHILLLEASGGSDFRLLEEAVRLGHQVTFFTGDIGLYRQKQPLEQSSLGLAREIVSIKLRTFNYEEFERRALAIHKTLPFDAILCQIDVRIIEASRLADKLSLPFLNPATAALMRDKFSARETLARHGIRQPVFTLTTSDQGLREAVERIGFPVLIKPADGYGSHNVSVLFSEDELRDNDDRLLPRRADYGFGVSSNNRFLVEQYLRGQLIGCDTFTRNGRHVFLGVNEKILFPPPSFAIFGGCFPSTRYDTPALREYVCKALDALKFDYGAAHTEVLVTEDGPHLVEINPRLVGAQISHLLCHAFERSIHADLIDLHLGAPLTGLEAAKPRWFAVSRWITAHRDGVLQSIEVPAIADARIRQLRIFAKPGERVRRPRENADRLAYVMTVGKTREEGEQLADMVVNGARLDIR